MVISTKFKSDAEDDTHKEDLLFEKLQKQDKTIDELNSQNIKLNVQLKNLTIKLDSMQQIKDQRDELIQHVNQAQNSVKVVKEMSD